MKRFAVIAMLATPLLFATVAQAATSSTFKDKTNDVNFCLKTPKSGVFYDCTKGTSPAADLASITVAQDASKNITIQTTMVDTAGFMAYPLAVDKYLNMSLTETTTGATIGVEAERQARNYEGCLVTIAGSRLDCSVVLANGGMLITIPKSILAGKYKVASGSQEISEWGDTNHTFINSWRDTFMAK